MTKLFNNNLCIELHSFRFYKKKLKLVVESIIRLVLSLETKLPRLQQEKRWSHHRAQTKGKNGHIERGTTSSFEGEQLAIREYCFMRMAVFNLNSVSAKETPPRLAHGVIGLWFMLSESDYFIIPHYYVYDFSGISSFPSDWQLLKWVHAAQNNCYRKWTLQLHPNRLMDTHVQ